MAFEKTTTRYDKTSSDEVALRDSESPNLHIKGFAILDDEGEQVGVVGNPLLTKVVDGVEILAEILTELKINNAYLQEIVGEKITEKELGG